MRVWISGFTLALLCSCVGDDPIPGGMDGSGGGNGGTASPMMSFFVSSQGNGALGGNFGGVEGMDALCNELAVAAGITGRVFAAYASTAFPEVNARDRIGPGPWFNFNGETIAMGVDDLHQNPPPGAMLLTDTGLLLPASIHDIITGSDPDGLSVPGNTCDDWIDGTVASQSLVGHTDWDLPEYVGTMSAFWNSSHQIQCDPEEIRLSLGDSRLYCFATGATAAMPDAGMMMPTDAGPVDTGGGPPPDTGMMMPPADTGMMMQTPDSGVIVDTGAMAGCPAPGGASNPSAAMSFFVTSVGNQTNGGNYGGLAGADERCRCLADAVGRGDRTWRAYLSTAPITGLGGTLVHARNRIGTGPWYNYNGELIATTVTALHGSPPNYLTIVDEYGNRPSTNEVDILTGTDTDGTALTEFPGAPGSDPPNCLNWEDENNAVLSWNGQSDHDQPGNVGLSWNSDHSAPCDPTGQNDFMGAGRLYCFSPNAPGLPDGGVPDSGVALDAAPVDSGTMTPADAGVVPDAGGGGMASATMNFFVTSSGNAGGGNFGGLAGADMKCQMHAVAAGAGQRTWRAYLSTDNPINDARDRIGAGPWFNYRGELIAMNGAVLHTTPPVEARILDENGNLVPRNVHDIVTGSDGDGIGVFAINCQDWTDGTDTSDHQVGHTDWDRYPMGDTSRSWNSSHGAGCSLATMQALLGEGRLYCFAID